MRNQPLRKHAFALIICVSIILLAGCANKQPEPKENQSEIKEPLSNLTFTKYDVQSETMSDFTIQTNTLTYSWSTGKKQPDIKKSKTSDYVTYAVKPDGTIQVETIFLTEKHWNAYKKAFKSKESWSMFKPKE